MPQLGIRCYLFSAFVLCIILYGFTSGIRTDVEDGHKPQFKVLRKNAAFYNSSFKQFNWDSIIMLIGDLDESGPNPIIKQKLLQRIDVAKTSGVDTILLVFRTSSIEDTFSELDEIINYAAEKDLSFIPRIVVNSKKFSEFIYTEDDVIPDYTNLTQLRMGIEILKNVITHLEKFPNVVAYQIEWGHYGESWVNSPFWNTCSSNSTFVQFIKTLSPAFQNITEKNFAKWVVGDIMYYSPYLPESDPRRSKLNVSLFYWYQRWRNEVTLNITWTFRSVARQLTSKPIIGFSYTGTWEVSYVYSANKYLDAAFCDATCNAYSSANTNFIKDAYFEGIHLGELDFDTPYFLLSEAEQVIKGMYKKGIVPVIFYPLWSTKLKDSDIPVLVSYMRKYQHLYLDQARGTVLLIFGRLDVGIADWKQSGSLACISAPAVSKDPPGLIALLEKYRVKYDIIDPEVYDPSIGNLYKVILVHTPWDYVDQSLLKKLEQTKSSVIIMHPSFVVGFPVEEEPTNVTSAIFGMWNMLSIYNQSVSLQVTGDARNVTFLGPFSDMETLRDYRGNHLFTYYRGIFANIYAQIISDQTLWEPVAVKVMNITLFGFDLHILNETHRSILEEFVTKLLKLSGLVADISIDGIKLTTLEPHVGDRVNITVYISNNGDMLEIFNITLCYERLNDPIIGIEEIALAPADSMNINFSWVPSTGGRYRISASTSEIFNDASSNDNFIEIELYIYSGSLEPGGIGFRKNLLK